MRRSCTRESVHRVGPAHGGRARASVSEYVGHTHAATPTSAAAAAAVSSPAACSTRAPRRQRILAITRESGHILLIELLVFAPFQLRRCLGVPLRIARWEICNCAEV